MGTARYEVIGDLPVVDCESAESVAPGGTVTLDDAVTKVDQLVAAGLVRPVKEPAPAKAKPAPGEG